MEDKVLCNMKKKSLFALIVCAIAMIVTIVCASPSEFLVTTIIGIYSLIIFLRIKGKKPEVKDLKNLILFLNILMVCCNLIKLIFMNSYVSGWELVVSFVMLVWYVVNTVYIYELFRGKMRLEQKVYNTTTIIQVVLLILAGILSRQTWAWGNVAFAVMAFVFARFLNSYSAVVTFKEENTKETLDVLGISEDINFKELPSKKKIWKLVGHIVLGIPFAIPMAINEWFGTALVAGVIIFVAPLIYIYRLGNAINEPKGMLYLSYFIPLVGMILYLIYVRNVKALGNACGKSALLGLCMPVIATLVVAPFIAGMYATMAISIGSSLMGLL